MKSSIRILLLISAFCMSVKPVGAQTKQNVRIMSFNLWHGGDGCKLPRDTSIKYELAAIKTSGADVVGLQEQTSGMGDKTSRAIILAEKLGWNHYIISGSRAVISRYKIKPVPPVKPQPANHQNTAGKNSQIVLIELPGTKTVAFGVMHLMYTPYESYDIADKKFSTGAEVIQSATKARMHEVKSMMDEAAPLMAKGIPVVLVGDFNEPSCLDWTPKAIRERNDPLLPFAVNWPCTDYILKSGFVDAYRQIHPNVKKKPGYTWTTMPGLWHDPEIHDRIDLIHVSKKGIRVKDAFLMGDQSELSDIVVTPWTSDHRAVVTELKIL